MGRCGSSSGGLVISYDVIGMFAGYIRTDLRNSRSLRQTVDAIMGMQRSTWVICKKCRHVTDSVTIWSRGQVKELWNLAKRTDWPQYRSEVGRQYLNFRFECPKCGTRAGLDEFGTGKFGSLDITTR